MSPAALLLVLGAAVCHATWNLLVKSQPRPLEVQAGALVLGVVLTSPVLLVYPLADMTPAAWLLVLLSALFETGYVFALSAAYAAGDLSLVYPVARGTAPLVVAPLAVALFGEPVSPQGGLGILLVVAGICVTHAGALRAWVAAAGSRRALGLALLSGVMTAAYSLVNRQGIREAPVPLYGFLVLLINVTLLGLALGLRRRLTWPPARPASWGRIGLVSVLMIVAYLAVLFAMARAPVGYVVAAREVSIVVAALLGALVLRERHSGARLAGAVLIFAGLAAIALSR
ncbi:MAG TPA: DMT family transporter [Methylomirabilota bacterium]|nr:DMT family transporter [Methylomirabilota bacterium]